MTAIADRLAAVTAEIAQACERWHRPATSVSLIAVSKFKPASDVQAALDAGQRVFGENRVQEALEKFTALRSAYPDLELHLIGPLQTNKARDAVTGFDVIETVDRPKLAEALAQALKRGEARVRRMLIEVNTGEEAQKAGILPLEADDFIERCRSDYGLPITGLMCIPPADDEPSLHFALLREMAKRHGLAELSMGMSADFGHAIQQGATHVRIGTAIFGGRDIGAG